MRNRLPVAGLFFFITVTVTVASAVAPGPPQALTSAVLGNTVTLTWQRPATGGTSSSYLVEAAVSPGGAVVASLPVPGNRVVVPNVANGVYYVTVRALSADAPSAPSNAIVVQVPSGPGGGCTAPPNAPVNLTSSVTGNLLALNWSPPTGGCAPSSYVVQAGSAPGLSNITVADVGAATSVPATAPAGTYHVRVVALNPFGGSAPSNEVVVQVPSSPGSGCTASPNAPVNLTSSVTGNLVTLNWSPPTGGCAPSSYAVQAGSAPGLSNITVANVGAATSVPATAPAGTYHVRVVALNPFGGSALSNEVVVTVGSSPLPAGSFSGFFGFPASFFNGSIVPETDMLRVVDAQYLSLNDYRL